MRCHDDKVSRHDVIRTKMITNLRGQGPCDKSGRGAAELDIAGLIFVIHQMQRTSTVHLPVTNQFNTCINFSIKFRE